MEQKIKDLKLNEKYEKKDLMEITKDDIGKSIETFGWVQKVRSQRTMTFFDLYAGFKTIKCVSVAKPEEDKLITQSASLKIFGEVKKNLNPEKDKHEFEFAVDNYVVVGTAPPFPINADTTPFMMMELGHLALRTPERALFLKARSHLMRIFRDYFYEKECIEVTPPTLVQTQVEGGSTLFKLDYYGKEAYLTQSSQLYLETVVPASHNAFCIMPSYRAEKSSTTRHLSEYTHVEAEFADYEFDDLINYIEEMVIYVMTRFYDDLRIEILKVNPSFEFVKIPKKILRLSYHDAIKDLIEMKILKSDGTPFEIGDDIPDFAERELCAKHGGFVFLMNFPVEFKPFYCKKSAENEKVSEAVDLLFPGIGEVLGGSMRVDNYDELCKGFEREEIDMEPYSWYIDLRRFGTFKHGGFGLGLERFLMGLMRYKNVNFACLYPRFLSRCTP